MASFAITARKLFLMDLVAYRSMEKGQPCDILPDRAVATSKRQQHSKTFLDQHATCKRLYLLVPSGTLPEITLG